MSKSRRKLRNLLLDRSLQLKFTAYAVVVTVAVAALVGVFLWKTAGELFLQLGAAVDARAEAARSSRELGDAVLLQRLLGRFEDPSFEKVLKERSAAIDQGFEEEKRQIERERAALELSRKNWGIALIASLSLLILLVALGAVVATHRVAGPLFRARRLARSVAEGKLDVALYPLRDGDHLHEFFNDMVQMVQSLSSREAAELERILAALRKDAPAEEVLGELAAQKRQRLGARAAAAATPAGE